MRKLRPKRLNFIVQGQEEETVGIWPCGQCGFKPKKEAMGSLWAVLWFWAFDSCPRLPPGRTPEAPCKQEELLEGCSGPQSCPFLLHPKWGFPKLGHSIPLREVLGRAVLRGKQGRSLTCHSNLVLLTQAAKGGRPRACRVSPAPSEPETFSPLPRKVAPAPSFRKPTKPPDLCQQHPCPWGCGPRLVSFRTPQSLPLAEIAGSEHKHHRLSLPPHVLHQPGMVSSPSIHHGGFLLLSLSEPFPQRLAQGSDWAARWAERGGRKLRAGTCRALSPAEVSFWRTQRRPPSRPASDLEEANEEVAGTEELVAQWCPTLWPHGL